MPKKVRCHSFFKFSISDTITLWGRGVLLFLPALFFADLLFFALNRRKIQEKVSPLLLIVGICLSYHYEPLYEDFLIYSVSFSKFSGDYCCRILFSFISVGYYLSPLSNKTLSILHDKKQLCLISISSIVMRGYRS